jgi:polyketide synthase PksJ
VEKLRKALIATGIKDDEGIKAFDTARNLSVPGVIVSTYDFNHRLRQYDEVKLFGQKTKKVLNEDDLHPRPDLNNAYVAPKNETETQIVNIWKGLLSLKQIGVQDDIFELGAHSLLLVEFHKELKETFETEISVVDLYKYTTVEALAKQIDGAGESEDALLEEVNTRAEKKKEARQKRRDKLAPRI